MKITVSKSELYYFLFAILCMFIGFLFFEIIPYNNIFEVKCAIIFQFVTFVALFVALGKVNKNLITLYSVFMIMFYLFQNGQLLLYALNVKFNYFYVERYPFAELYESVKFSMYCMCSAFAAGVFSFRESKKTHVNLVDKIPVALLYKISRIGFFITGIIAYLLVIFKFFVWINGRYSGVLYIETLIPSLLGAIESLYPAFSILTILSGAKLKRKIIPLLFLFSFWGLLTALMGDRTTGLAVIVIIALMYYKNIFGNHERNKRLSNRIIFYVMIVVVLFLVSFGAAFRNQQDYTIGSIIEVLLSIVEELGFSFFPLITIMNLCPNVHPFLNGKSMISSVVSGFIPESIDFFGLFSKFADSASIPTHWIAERHQYGFGMDCSLNAECYANFGTWGFIAMFFICVVIAVMLKNIDYTKDNNIFAQYGGLAMLFAWFTLPRRRSYYIYNKIFWYIFIIGVFIILMSLIFRKKRSDKIVSKR